MQRRPTFRLRATRGMMFDQGIRQRAAGRPAEPQRQTQQHQHLHRRDNSNKPFHRLESETHLHFHRIAVFRADQRV
jgi:hypothetical protein